LRGGRHGDGDEDDTCVSYVVFAHFARRGDPDFSEFVVVVVAGGRTKRTSPVDVGALAESGGGGGGGDALREGDGEFFLLLLHGGGDAGDGFYGGGV